MQTIKNCILEMAGHRGTDKTICPSEVARELFPANWRDYMDEVRQTAFQLQQENKIIIMQKGRPVKNAVVKGPIRIRIVT